MAARKPNTVDDPDWVPMIRNTQHVDDGATAYALGFDVDDCPFPAGNRRTEWMTGWYDSRTKDRLGPLLERNGLEWP